MLRQEIVSLLNRDTIQGRVLGLISPAHPSTSPFLFDGHPGHGRLTGLR
jgi:hypothetical protein